MTVSLKRSVLLAAIVCGCVGCDQATKAVARGCLATTPRLSFFGDLFRLQLVENRGAFLGLGSNLPENLRTWLIVAGAAVWLLGLGFVLSGKELNRPRSVALALILAGGIGNLLDRIFNHNAVVDFMNLGIGHLRTGIFNVADIALMCGTALLLWFSMEHRDSSS